jgi:hypothetical protein
MRKLLNKNVPYGEDEDEFPGAKTRSPVRRALGSLNETPGFGRVIEIYSKLGLLGPEGPAGDTAFVKRRSASGSRFAYVVAILPMQESVLGHIVRAVDRAVGSLAGQGSPTGAMPVA